MKVAFPHMGNLYISVSSALRYLGAEVIIPPYNNKKTLMLGAKHSPEAICLPYKLVLGNYIEAIEAGAEAILMVDSPGVCRLGQYSSSCRCAIEDLGYKSEFINFDLYKGKVMELYSGFKKATGNGNPIDLFKAIQLAFVKIEMLDKIDHTVAYYRPREVEEGITDVKYKQSVNLMDLAMTVDECKDALEFSNRLFSRIEIDEKKEILDVDLTGEIFMVLDSFSNLEIEKELGRLGVHVHRKLNMSDWTKEFLTPAFLRFAETHGQKAERFAKSFLTRDIGGDAIESIGDAVHASQNNSDGLIHLLPFTCMPEIITQNILPSFRAESDFPVLSLVLDEQMGKAGYVTRIEAFVDLIRRRRRQKDTQIAVSA